MTPAPINLRDQKKQQTRQAISDVATALFMEHGFEAVTIADIANAARVAKMTVTNYFPRKEDLALDLGDAFIGSLAKTVAERAVGESALAALRRAFLADVKQRNPVIGFAGVPFIRMIVDSPTLTARLRDFHDRRELALAEQLADDGLSTTGDSLAPRIVAAQFGAAHRALFDETVRRTLAGDDPDQLSTALTRAGTWTFDLLEASLGSYAIRT
ncbi:TetR/AcrR family transcriptional regulator [Actinoplanes regularis]|nr:TetR/AcrR family transcriptional regulator [Actinoplanes regularis]GIE85523.1 TetR family transcriptional regulator [Actinoplanes regularis]